MLVVIYGLSECSYRLIFYRIPVFIANSVDPIENEVSGQVHQYCLPCLLNINELMG